MVEQVESSNKFVELDRLATSLKNQTLEHKLSAEGELDALHELFGNAVGLKREEEVSVSSTARTPRMTHQELQAMKFSSAKVLQPKVKFTRAALETITKCLLTVKGWFVFKDPRRKVCQQIGHQCSHCGMNVPFHHD